MRRDGIAYNIKGDGGRPLMINDTGTPCETWGLRIEVCRDATGERTRLSQPGDASRKPEQAL